MAGEAWKDYTDNPVPGVVLASPKNDDPWAEYSEEGKSNKSRNKVSDLPLSKAFNAKLDEYGLGKILPRLPETTDINKNQVGMSTSVIKGVPFVQHLIPDNPYQKEWEKENPIQDFAGRAFGFAGSAGAGANAVAAKVGEKFIPQLFSQMGYGGLLGSTNEAVRQQVKGEEFNPYKIALTGAMDAGIGSTGPILGKLFSPGAATTNKFAPLEKAIQDAGWSPVQVKNLKDLKDLTSGVHGPDLQRIAQAFEQQHYNTLFKAAEHATTKIPEAVRNALLSGVIAGGISGHHPLAYGAGILLGGASPYAQTAKDAIAKSAPIWWHNNVARTDPTARAILNNLVPTVKHGLEE